MRFKVLNALFIVLPPKIMSQEDVKLVCKYIKNRTRKTMMLDIWLMFLILLLIVNVIECIFSSVCE